MAAKDFTQINPIERMKLSGLLGGDDMAQRFWDEVVRPMVDGFARYAVRPGSELAPNPRGRYGADLDKHMRKVVKAAKSLRGLLDADTIQHLVHPPSRVFWGDDFGARQLRNIQRVRDLRRLLEEIEFEIEIPITDPATGDTKHLTEWGRSFEIDKATGEVVASFESAPLVRRLDCFLAASVVRWHQSQKGLSVTRERLLDAVFSALQMGSKKNDQAHAGHAYTAIESIKAARARKLIP